MSRKLPKPYLEVKPQLRAVVICCSDPMKHWKAVVTNTLPDSPSCVEITSLQTRKVEIVPFRELVKGKC
jgi:hypothetical protein